MRTLSGTGVKPRCVLVTLRRPRGSDTDDRDHDGVKYRETDDDGHDEKGDGVQRAGTIDPS
jgi:hypothetical protein